MGLIVKCTLPNASERISGLAFTRQPDGSMWSEEIEEAAAERFRGIPGYVVEPPQPIRRAVRPAEAD
ncbi:MAG: hypothetical protein WA840_22750 [Caulobacteraceae bacterium]